MEGIIQTPQRRPRLDDDKDPNRLASVFLAPASM